MRRPTESSPPLGRGGGVLRGVSIVCSVYGVVITKYLTNSHKNSKKNVSDRFRNIRENILKKGQNGHILPISVHNTVFVIYFFVSFVETSSFQRT